MNSRCAIAAWLECFQEKRVGVGMNRSARGGILRYIKRYIYHTFIIYAGEVCAYVFA